MSTDLDFMKRHDQARAWCSLCGKWAVRTVDVSYPENCENAFIRGSIRICAECGKRIYEVAASETTEKGPPA